MRLNLFDYQESQKIAARDEPIAALIAAAMRRADTDNYEKLARAFPLIARDLYDRYNASGGKLPGEE